MLRAGNSTVRATTLYPLRQGEWYVVRPEMSRGRVSLRVEGQVARDLVASEIIRHVGLPESDLAGNLVRAFVRAGLPLEAGRLQRVYRQLTGSGRDKTGDTREIARLAALAERKGLGAVEGLLEAVLGAQGRPEDFSRRDRGGGKGRDSEPARRGADGVRAAFALGEKAETPLQLFNHMTGEGDHWIIVPISLAGGEVRASLRIRVPRSYALGSDPAAPAYREAVVVAENAGRRWVFGLQPSSEGTKVILLSEEGAPWDAAAVGIDELAERLKRAGANFHHAVISKDSNDGFSSADAPAIMASVDSNA